MKHLKTIALLSIVSIGISQAEEPVETNLLLMMKPETNEFRRTRPATTPQAIWQIFEIVAAELEKTKSVDATKTLFNSILNELLTQRPDILNQIGPMGLTPAHRFVIDYLLFTRGIHNRGIEVWQGQLKLYGELFSFIFNKLNTKKAVIATTTNNPLDEVIFSYLKQAGMTEEPMTAAQLRDAFMLEPVVPHRTMVETVVR